MIKEKQSQEQSAYTVGLQNAVCGSRKANRTVLLAAEQTNTLYRNRTITQLSNTFYRPLKLYME